MPKGIYNRNAPRKERPIPILTELNDVFACPKKTAEYLEEKGILPDKSQLICKNCGNEGINFDLLYIPSPFDY
jgi:hypothetical protein